MIQNKNIIRLCSIKDCNRKHLAKGLCSSHYYRKDRAEHPERYKDSRKYPWWTSKTKEEQKEYYKERYQRYGHLGELWRKKNQLKVKVRRHQYKVKCSYPEAFEVGNITDEELLEWLRIHINDPCPYCAGPSDHIDHIVPLCSGGAHTWDNIQMACGFCNLAKRMNSEEYFLNKIKEIYEHRELGLKPK